MSTMKTMDNPLALELTQQDKIDLSWMGGLLDGEGSFNLHRKRPRPSGGAYIHLQIRMGNTNPQIVSEYVKLLDKFGITYHISHWKRQSNRHKPCDIVIVNRLTSCERLCGLLIPYLRGKRGQAELVARFVRSRMERAKTKYNVPYNQQEAGWMDELRDSNRKGVRDCTLSAEQSA